MFAWILACAPSSSPLGGPPSRRAKQEARQEPRAAPPPSPELDAGSTDETEGLDDVPAEVRASLERRRRSRAGGPSGAPTGTLPASGSDVPLLVAPFSGTAAAPSWFNHGGAEKEDRSLQLAFNGSWIQGSRTHLAYDYLMPTGTPIFAAADGVVARARDGGQTKCASGQDSDQSIQLKIVHPEAPDGQTYMTSYMHLSKLQVSEGETVRAGQQVALSGNTGCSKSPHLHFEVTRITNLERLSGQSVDPYGWAGSGPDPMAGRHNVNLWKPGQAPPLRRGAKGANGDHPVAINNLRALDALEPTAEFVQVGHRREGQPTRLEGYVIATDGGTRIPLPNVTLGPGELLRIWTSDVPTVQRADRDEERPTREIGLGRNAPIWNDTGDCARLYDPRGRLVSDLSYGKFEDSSGGCRSEPVTDLE